MLFKPATLFLVFFCGIPIQASEPSCATLMSAHRSFVFTEARYLVSDSRDPTHVRVEGNLVGDVLHLDHIVTKFADGTYSDLVAKVELADMLAHFGTRIQMIRVVLCADDPGDFPTAAIFEDFRRRYTSSGPRSELDSLSKTWMGQQLRSHGFGKITIDTLEPDYLVAYFSRN